MRNYFCNLELKVFVDDFGIVVGVLDFYGVLYLFGMNILVVFGIWLFWIVMAYAVMKNVWY